MGKNEVQQKEGKKKAENKYLRGRFSLRYWSETFLFLLLLLSLISFFKNWPPGFPRVTPADAPGPLPSLPPAAARSAQSIPGAAAAQQQPPAGCPAVPDTATAAARRGKPPGPVKPPCPATPLLARALPGEKAAFSCGRAGRKKWSSGFIPPRGRVSPS